MADISDVARRFDDVLRNMAGQAGSLEALLGVFFSFLHRNTDFYVTYDPSATARAGMGFPLGKAEKLLMKAFRSFPFKPYDERQSKPTRGGAKQTQAKATSRNPPTVKPQTVSASDRIGESKSSAPRRPKSKDANEGLAPTVITTPTPVSRQPSVPTENYKSSTDVLPQSSTLANASTTSALESDAPQSGASPGDIRVHYTEDGKQVPIGNGGVTPRYYWTQTIGEATVYVDVPPGTRSKDVSCVIEPRRLKLVVRGAGDATEGRYSDVLIEGELPSAVSREESMWSLVDGKMVVISFEKASRSWWKSVVEGDPEIDTTQVMDHGLPYALTKPQ